MSQGTARGGEGRLANVTGALWLDPSPGRAPSSDAAERGIAMLAGLFEEILLVGDVTLDHAGARTIRCSGERAAALLTALQAARSPRVLWLDADAEDATPEKILALTAWPQHEVVLLPGGDVDEPNCALLDRDAVIATSLSSNGADPPRLAALDVVMVDDPKLVPAAPTK